jgi:hypothetical protein
VDDLTTTQGIVALAAAGAAVVALVWLIVLSLKLRRLRSAQRTVMGNGERQDLVAHAAALQDAFVQLRDWVEENAAGLDQRMAAAEHRIEGCVAYTSLIRYDAYGEMSGHQSSTLALLDSHRTGVVVSSIVNRDQARVYVKQLHEGVPQLELSPEETEAVETAMSGARAEA